MYDPMDLYLIASFFITNFKFQLKIPIVVALDYMKNVNSGRQIYYF